MNSESAVRKVTIFVSSPTDVMAERERAARVIDRLQSRFREHVTIVPVFFEDKENYFTADKSPQEQIPDASETDLVISLFWSKLGTPLPADLFGTMPDGNPYPGGAVYELIRALDRKRQKNLPDILIYRKIADTGVSVTDPRQRRLMTEQLDAFETFWRQWFVSQEGHFRAGFQTFHRPDDFEQLLEGHLRAWLDEQKLLGKEVIWRIAERGSPFRGLAPYESQHAEVFFGRDREIDLGRQRLITAASGGAAFLLIMGPSGSGKSSLARAGVLTRLTQPGDLDGVDLVRAAVMRPGEAATPQRALADALFREKGNDAPFPVEALPELVDSDFPDPERLASALMSEASAAAAPILRTLDRVAAHSKATKDYDRPVEIRLLLVIDQLEELFSGATRETARLSFVRLIAALARSGRVLVIGTLRSSSYGSFAREPDLVALKDAGTTLDLAVPGPEVLADIVRKPAASAGLTFDRRGDESLDAVLLAAARGNVDALPLLGFTLQELFDNRDAERLTFAAYEQLGRLEGAIGRAAEEVFASLDTQAQGALPQLLRGLAETAVRGAGLALREMPFTAVPEGTPIRRLVDALISARVLLIHGQEQGASIRLAHDAVLRGWDRAREITDREQDFFRIREDVAAAEQRWSKQPHDDRLLGAGLPLAEAQSIRERYGQELDRNLVAYIEASARYHEAEADKRRRREMEVQSNLLAQVADSECLRGSFGTGLKLCVHAARRHIEAQRGISGHSRPAATLAAAVSQTGWRLLLAGHQYSVKSAAFSPDSARIVTASNDKTARIWDAASGRETTVLRGHEGWVESAAFSPEGARIVTASRDTTARIWDAASGKEITVLRGHEHWVRSAAFSPDGARIVTASSDKTARIWDAASGKEITVLRGHEHRVQSAAFSSDGARIVTASEDNTARIWDAASGKEITVLRGHEARVYSAAFSPDGARIVTASDDKTARIWNTASGKEITLLRGHEDYVQSAAFSPDGARIVTASDDKTARIWNTASGKEITLLRGHEDYVQSAAFSPDGARIVTASDDKTARIWDAASGKEITVLRGHEDFVQSAAFSPDGARIVTASDDKTARIWDAASGKEITVLRGHEDPVRSAAFSPGGARIVTASEDTTARIWDTASGNEITVLRGHEGWVMSAAFSPDGARIVTASEDTTARIWDATSGKKLTVLRGHEEYVRCAVFSPNGARIVTGSWDKTARIWDAASGKEITVLRGHEDDVWSAAFSPDGARIVTASGDKTARIWDAASGKEITVLRGHDGWVQSAAFSPDGARIVTASADKDARIWDAASGKEITVLRGHEEYVRSAAFSPDGTRIVTASGDKTARIWNAHFAMMFTKDLLVEACTRRLRGLTKLSREEMRLAGYSDDTSEIDVCAGIE